MTRTVTMIIRNTLPLFLLLTLFACNEAVETIPDNVLSKEDMVSVMVDIQLIEAALSINQSEEAKETAYYNYDSVLKQHNLSKEKFDESFKYYSEHPELMEQIYEEMLSELSKRQAEVESGK